MLSVWWQGNFSTFTLIKPPLWKEAASLRMYQQTRGLPSPPFGLSSTTREFGPSSTVLLQTSADEAAWPCKWSWLLVSWLVMKIKIIFIIQNRINKSTWSVNSPLEEAGSITLTMLSFPHKTFFTALILYWLSFSKSNFNDHLHHFFSHNVPTLQSSVVDVLDGVISWEAVLWRLEGGLAHLGRLPYPPYPSGNQINQHTFPRPKYYHQFSRRTAPAK